MSVDFERWKLFLLVSELGSLSKAAAVLNRPQPVISRHVNALEAQCGCTLFYRTGRGVALTEVGQATLPRVAALVGDAEQLLLDIKGQAGVPVGRVSVGLLPSIRIAGDLVRTVREKYPDVDLHITEASGGQLGEQIATGRIDLGFVLREPGALMPTEEALLRLPLCWVAPAGDALAARGTVSLGDIADKPLIMAKPPNALRLHVENVARRAGLNFQFAVQVDPLATQRLLVAQGQGYTITTRGSVRDEVEQGILSAADIVDPRMELMLVMLRSNQRPATLAIRAVARIVSELTRALPDRYAADTAPAYLPVARMSAEDNG